LEILAPPHVSLEGALVQPDHDMKGRRSIKRGIRTTYVFTPTPLVVVVRKFCCLHVEILKCESTTVMSES
jgi:hypothetical protein